MFQKTCILEFGMSDFHKLSAVSLKLPILRVKWKFYRYYKAFDENRFNNDLKSKLDSIKIIDYSSFEDTFINVLNIMLLEKRYKS